MNIVLRTPEAITAYVLENYAAVSEEQIGQFERDVAKACPRSWEKGLLYALRVSKCVPTVKSFKTLSSRRGTALNGPQSAGGLLSGTGSPNYQTTHDFLVKLHELVVPWIWGA